MNKKLIEALVCPACKGRLDWQKEKSELWCRAEKLAYPIRSDIPVMLLDEARKLPLDELDQCAQSHGD